MKKQNDGSLSSSNVEIANQWLIKIQTLEITTRLNRIIKEKQKKISFDINFLLESVYTLSEIKYLLVKCSPKGNVNLFPRNIQ